jgi:tRNA (cytidine/uridine-2'-O-)-methyltransferase
LSHLIEMAAYEPDFAPNLGSLVRLGACFNVPINVIEPCGFPFSLKSLRSRGLDYVEKAELHHHNNWKAFKLDAELKSKRLILLSTKSSLNIWDFSFRRGDCLVLGRESAGVPEDIHNQVDQRVFIPMPGGGRSLNVAITAGIALAEALRQLG